jgi:basic amino acid/polyamine antiporter, APA family
MGISSLFRKKSVESLIAHSEGTGEHTLKRSLGAWNLTSLGVGGIIGAGIFVMTGQAAANYAGPAILISFVLAGICCAFAALCYAELASMIPVSGSAYSYAYASLGEIVAWIMGWLLLLEYGVSAATVATGWGGYLTSFLADLGIIIPDALKTPTIQVIGAGTPSVMWVTGETFNLPAFFGVLMCTFMLLFGIKESANANNVIVAVKLFVIALFIIFGISHVDFANLHPFIPDNQGGDKYGYPGILRAAGVIFFAYIGFEAVSTAAQEAKNPQKDVPIGIIGSLVICTVIYMIVAFILVGIVPYTTLNVPDPIAVGVDAIGMGWLAFLVKIGAIAGLSSVMLVMLFAQTRVFFTMSRDGLIPPVFGHVHPKYKTPWLNTIILGSVISIIAGCTPISILGDLVSLGTLTAFCIICFSVFYLRIKQPERHRPFSVPFPMVTPILGILCCGYLIYGLSEVFAALKYYFIIGLVIYFAYGRRKSVLGKASA